MYKQIELDDLPRMGDVLTVECSLGMVELEVVNVLWQEGKKAMLFLVPGPLGQTSFGEEVLTESEWQHEPV